MLKDALQSCHQNTADWLRFAEAKNMALVAFDSAVLAALLGTFHTAETSRHATVWIIAAGSVLIALGLIGGMIALSPRRRIPTFIQISFNQKQDANPFFWGDLASIDGARLLELLSLDKNTDDQHKIHQWMANQAIINARIASYKFRVFEIAAWTSVLGIVFVALGLALLTIERIDV